MEKEILTLKNDYKFKLGIKLSRGEIRKAKHELSIFEKQVEPLVNEFEDILFDGEGKFGQDLNYKDLYNIYLERITKICDRLNKFQFKIICVDNYFFSEIYKPLERAPN